MHRPMSLPVPLPAIVVTPADSGDQGLPLRRPPPPEHESSLLQVPRRMSPRQQQREQQRQLPPRTLIYPPFRYDRNTQQMLPRPQPIPIPEPVSIPETIIIEEEPEEQEEQEQGESAAEKATRAVLDTLKGLERYCENLLVNRPPNVELAAPQPVASSTFKKAHRRVHSVDISVRSGRPGVATFLTPRRKRSISSTDEIFAIPKASMQRGERTIGRRVVSCPAEEFRRQPLPCIVDTSALVRAPQPTLCSTRSTRADLNSLISTAPRGATLMIPEGSSPAVVAAAGYYATLSKNAAFFGQKVLQPLKRYVSV